jgi:hypothetical protein
MSYWTNANYIDINNKKNNDLNENKFLMKLSSSFIKKHYKEIHLITDYKGEELFKDFGWSSIDTFLEDLPKEYDSVWSLGKIKSYLKICKKGDPFLHLDHDFFITKPLDQNIFNNDIIVEDREYIPSYGYNVDYFEANCPDLFLAKNTKIDFAYRCGILGGKNLCFLFDYASSALKLTLSDNNKNFFLKNIENHRKINPNFGNVNKSTLIEQYYLAACLNKWNKNPFIFWQKANEELTMRPNHGIYPHGKSFYSPGMGNQEFFNKTGCFHPYGSNKYLYKEKYRSILISLL